MPSLLYQMLPAHSDLLALEPEELAGVLLAMFNQNDGGGLNRYNFGLHHTVEEYPRQYHVMLSQALMEAWAWLEREGLIAPKPGQRDE